MSAQDKKQIEKANARNAVEEYVYDMKDKLEESYKEFITEQVILSDSKLRIALQTSETISDGNISLSTLSSKQENEVHFVGFT